MIGNEIRALAARMEAAGGKRILMSEASARVIARALEFYADALDLPKDECLFTVQTWNDNGGIEETLARASNGLVARAAYDAACKERPRNELTLRHGCRLIAKREAEEKP